MKITVLLFALLQACVVPTVYTTTWCGWCGLVKEHLTIRGVKYIEKDVEKDPANWQDLRLRCDAAGLPPPDGVPYTVIGDDVIAGADTEAIDASLCKYRLWSR